eukprot:GHVU01168018.1.p4 GENE.GHVU01168018.1~~GHVU01168018.1.p4  ORF type:complete len:107 (-),score=1.47 GHVU01168018.1:69-389(-)
MREYAHTYFIRPSPIYFLPLSHSLAGTSAPALPACLPHSPPDAYLLHHCAPRDAHDRIGGARVPFVCPQVPPTCSPTAMRIHKHFPTHVQTHTHTQRRVQGHIQSC